MKKIMFILFCLIPLSSCSKKDFSKIGRMIFNPFGTSQNHKKKHMTETTLTTTINPEKAPVLSSADEPPCD
jgi:hypothetical protein